VAGGFAGLALFDLLSRDGFFQSALEASPSTKTLDLSNPLTPRQPHFAAKAKRVVFLFMNGAPSPGRHFRSQTRLEPFPRDPVQRRCGTGRFERPALSGHIMQSPFRISRHGPERIGDQQPVSRTPAKFADDLCVIRSMYTDTAAACLGLSSDEHGQRVDWKPSLGAWLSYGLGSQQENLPSFVVMTDPRGGPDWQRF
jgi:hypothetical protein